MPKDTIENRISRLTTAQLELLADRLGVSVSRQQRVVAFCETSPGHSGTVDPMALRSHLEQQIPRALLPADIQILERLPRLPNGKIDFGTLSKLQASSSVQPPKTPPPSRPHSPSETTLLKIWTDVLGTDAIHTNDNFFELGGDSISSIHVLALANKAGLEIPSHAIFDHPTIAGLARVATSKAIDPPSPPSPDETTRSPDSGSEFPTNSVQRAFFLKNRTDPPGDPGIIQVQCGLSGKLDQTAFQNTWHALFQRHSGLRSCIEKLQGLDPQMKINASSNPAPIVRFEDIGDLTPENQATRIADLIGADRSLPLDITSAPVARLTLISRTPQSHVLLWTCHHALIDGWSASVVLEEFAPLYRSLLAGEPATLSSAPTLTEYHTWLGSQDEIAEEWFWRNQFQGLKPGSGQMPIDRLGSASRPSGFETHSAQLPQHVVAALETAARSSHSTPYLLFLAAWGLCLASYGNRSDVVFGATLSGRSPGFSGSDHLVGLLANSLPFRARIQGDETVAEFLGRLQKTQKELLEFQHVDLSKIHHRWSGVPLATPLFESLVVFANFLDRKVGSQKNSSGAPLTVDSSTSGISSTFPATLTIVPGTPWRLNLVYDSARISPSMASELMGKMSLVIENISHSTEQPIRSLLPPPSPLPSRHTPSKTEPAQSVQDLSPTESRLIEIWRNAFGDDSIGLDHDFVALGGHSLLSVVLITEIELEFRCSLPTASILKAPTPRKLAALVRQTRSEGKESVAAPEAFIFIPGGFGDTLYFLELRRTGGRDLEVSGEIRARKLRVNYTETTPVANVAARYASEIRKLQPDGPIYLASRFCAEFISLDIARHLADSGEPIAFLGIIDHAPPSPPAVSSQTAKRFGRKWLQMMRQRQFTELSNYARRTPGILFKGLSSRLKTAAARSSPSETPGQDPGRFYYTEGFHSEFTARPYPGRVTLFFSSEFEKTEIGKVTIERWMEQALGGVEVVRIPGSRYPDIFSAPGSSYLNNILNKLAYSENP